MATNAATVVIKFPQSQLEYDAAFDLESHPPHHNEPLKRKLHDIVTVESIRPTYGEPCMYIRVSIQSAPGAQYVLSQILETFREHGYEMTEVI